MRMKRGTTKTGGTSTIGKNLKWVIGWFLKVAITELENKRKKLRSSIRTLKIGGGFNLPREELREVIRGRIRERQKEPTMSDIEGHEIMRGIWEKRKPLGRRKG